MALEIVSILTVIKKKIKGIRKYTVTRQHSDQSIYWVKPSDGLSFVPAYFNVISASKIALSLEQPKLDYLLKQRTLTKLTSS